MTAMLGRQRSSAVLLLPGQVACTAVTNGPAQTGGRERYLLVLRLVLLR
jgi:hypothetical protein